MNCFVVTAAGFKKGFSVKGAQPRRNAAAGDLHSPDVFDGMLSSSDLIDPI